MVFTRGKPAPGHGAGHLAIFPHRNAPAPSHKPGIAIVSDIVTLLRVPSLLANLFGWLALPSGGPGLFGGNADRRDRSTVQSGKGNQFSVRISHGDHPC